MVKGDIRKYREAYKGEKVGLVLFRHRFYKGRDKERALTEPVGKSHGGSRKGKFFGKFQQVWNEIKDDVHPTLNKTTVQSRLYRGWNYNKAISIPYRTVRGSFLLFI